MGRKRSIRFKLVGALTLSKVLRPPAPPPHNPPFRSHQLRTEFVRSIAVAALYKTVRQRLQIIRMERHLICRNRQRFEKSFDGMF